MERLLVSLVLVGVGDVLHILVVLVVEEAGVVVLLLHVVLRRTVLLLLLLLGLLGFGSFQRLLGLFELVEDVLVMEDCVGELVLEN